MERSLMDRKTRRPLLSNFYKKSLKLATLLTESIVEQNYYVEYRTLYSLVFVSSRPTTDLTKLQNFEHLVLR